MVLEVQKAAITINNIAVPGIYRNGLFVGETPTDTFVLFQSDEVAQNQNKVIAIQYPVCIDTIFISDREDDSIYIFNIKPINQEVQWTLEFKNENYINLGHTNVINFPRFILEKGAILTFNPSNTISAIAMFAKLAHTIEIKDY